MPLARYPSKRDLGLYYTIYLKLKNPMSSEEIANLLSLVLSIKIEPIRIKQRLDLLNSVEKDLSRNWQKNSSYQFFYWGSIVLYGVLVFRDSASKFEERKKDLALLLALGSNVRNVMFMVFVELFVSFVIVTNLMKEFNEKYGTTFIIATHDASIINKVNRVIKINNGKIIEDLKNIND
ncbi:MAG: hypothetical protein ACP5IZ_02555 [Thermoprotei archaeon]